MTGPGEQGQRSKRQLCTWLQPVASRARLFSWGHLTSGCVPLVTWPPAAVSSS